MPDSKPQTTAETVIATVISDHLSAGERAYREQETAAREVIEALNRAGFRLIDRQLYEDLKLHFDTEFVSSREQDRAERKLLLALSQIGTDHA